MEAIKKLAGGGGSRFLAVTTAHTSLKLFALVVNSDAVFTTLTATKDDASATTINMLTSAAHNFAGATVSQGAYIVPPDGYFISAVTMSSGNCTGYIKYN